MAGTNHSPSESDPLLPPAEFTNQSPENHVVEEDTDTRTTAQRIKIAIPCVLTMFLMVVSDTMLTIPVMQIRERIICRQMYRDISYKGATDDPRCKGNDVAAELSLLSGWELTFMLIPSILTGVPWGIAADKYGRRHVLQFANIGVLGTALWQVLIYSYPDVFPLRLVWLQAIFLFSGGGVSTYAALLFTIAADVSTRAQRTTALLVLATAMRLVSVAAGPLCYLAMQGGDWFAVYLGVALWCLIFPVTAMIPETRSNVAIKKVQLEAASTDAMPRSTSCLNLKPKLNAAVAQTKMVINTIFLQNPSLGILLFSTLFTTLGKTSDSLLAQYATKRFDWKWSEASLISSMKSLISIGLTALVLPVISQLLLTKAKLPPLIKDKWIVVGSAAMLTLGSGCITIATTSALFITSLVIFQLGCGFEFAFRGLTTELVDESHVAMLFTAQSVFMTLSEVAAGPVLAGLYRKGLDLGGFWLSMPFLVSTFLFATTTVITFVVRVRPFVPKTDIE